MNWWHDYEPDEIRWHDVGALSDWAEGAAQQVAIGARHIVVYRQGDVCYALKDRCPHAGAPLHQGVASREGIACPRHGWVFDWHTGQGPGSCATTPYPVKIIDGRVWVGV